MHCWGNSRNGKIAMPPARSEIDNLISLLDDEDESIAVNAMAELLRREGELDDALAAAQESDNVLLRRRVHQLQAAITLRRRRREFFRKLHAAKIDLIDGLIDVHLQWFDNDSRPGLVQLWSDFLLESRRYPQHTLENIAYFMRKSGFTVQPETTMRPEYYCIGPILENATGSAAILAAIAAEIAAPELKLRFVRVMGEFAVHDGERLLIPERNWRICPAPDIEHCDFWDRRMLLKYASMTLFSCAVNSDSFRYVLTIAQALSGEEEDRALDYFPYPYCPADDEDDVADDNDI